MIVSADENKFAFALALQSQKWACGTTNFRIAKTADSTLRLAENACRPE